MRRHLHRILLAVGLVTVTVLTLVAAPAPADAQWHGRARFYVSFGGFWPYPYWGPYWGPHFGFGFGYPWGAPYYPYGPYGPYPWPYYYGWDPNSASARMQVTPREAKVFVDGYSAGVVDDFDGTFQRLRARSGGHEVTVYLDGYRTVSQHVYFRPDSTQNIRFTMEKTAPGEVSEPPPAPQPPPSRGREGGDPDRPQVERPSRGEPQGPPIEQAPPTRYGTLSIAVQPVDAEIYLDGERWTGPSPGPGAIQRLTIRVTEGRHRVEIRKGGFATYSEQILIGRDRTLTLNVSLNK